MHIRFKNFALYNKLRKAKFSLPNFIRYAPKTSFILKRYAKSLKRSHNTAYLQELKPHFTTLI